MSENKQNFFSRLKLILKQPLFYSVAVVLLYLFCFLPLLRHPEILFWVLPESLFEHWCKFAELHLSGILFCALSFTLILFFFCFAILLCRSKTTLGGIYFIMMLLLLFFCFPKLGTPHARSKQYLCASNLKQLYLAMLLYVDESGNLPPDLKTLETSGVMNDPKSFRCPNRLHPNSEFSDYEYYGKGRSLKEEAPFLLLEDRAKNHIVGKYRNQLKSDGSIIKN